MPDPFTLPEFTRSLRAFASVQALGTPIHDRVFAPLLTARRTASRMMAPESRVAAFDAERLRRSLISAIEATAAERSGGDAATQRALVARLEEAAAPAFDRLVGLAHAAQAVRSAPEPERAAAWTRWCDAVRAVFEGFDRLLLSVDHVAPPHRHGPIRLTMDVGKQP